MNKAKKNENWRIRRKEKKKKGKKMIPFDF